MEILDCTLRDGGYYTNWDFDGELVDVYIKSLNQLPIDYVEIGYRSLKKSGYLGKFFYSPIYLLEHIRGLSKKKIAIILNEKDIRVGDVKNLLTPCVGNVDFIRIAVSPAHFERALGLAREIKNLGFKVALNVMYMSSWREYPDFINGLSSVGKTADVLYMVDSYGGIYPQEVIELIKLIRERTDITLGFHGHNNLELALINTLTAIDNGVKMVDSTICGMGRGAGNLKTELLLTSLVSNQKINEFDFNALSKVVAAFSNLKDKYKWGTILPYMVSGASSLPQSDVMEWVGKRYYSLNSIIRALENKRKGVQDNKRLPLFESGKTKYNKALIVGGGSSAVKHSRAINKYLEQNPDMVIIHASSKNAMAFKNVERLQIFGLVGNEGYRMEDVFTKEIPANAVCVLPPFPREMGTYIPSKMANRAYELKANVFSDNYTDSHTAIALQTALDIGVREVELVGYDGYTERVVTIKEQELFSENEYLFSKFAQKSNIDLVSLTPTTYKNLSASSIYGLIYER